MNNLGVHLITNLDKKKNLINIQKKCEFRLKQTTTSLQHYNFMDQLEYLFTP
jgi:hypothetical protein